MNRTSFAARAFVLLGLLLTQEAQAESLPSKRIHASDYESACSPEPWKRLRHTWLTEAEKDALRRTATEGGVAYNTSSMTTPSAKRAIAAPVRADEWVLYIEYVAPSA